MFPFSLIHLEQTDSTNTYLEELLLESSTLDEFIVVTTPLQLSGKGQGSNKWHSTAHQNIQFSLLLKPNFLEAGAQFHLNMSISIALIDFLLKLFPDKKIKIKWPNDIYIDNNKIAGILIKLFVQKEKIENAIVGIGFNVNETNFPEEIVNPISMKQIADKEFSVNSLREEILFSILLQYKMLPNISSTEIKNTYLSHLYRFQEKHSYFYKGSMIQANIVDISEFGQLILEKMNGERLICNMGDIKFIL